MDLSENEGQGSAVDDANFSHFAASEFNVEIGIRQRMTEAINSRIAWAMLLKESLQAGTQPPSIAPVSFRYAALDALKTSDKSVEFFLDKEEPAPPNTRLQQALLHARPAPKSKAPNPRNPKTTFLYIRSTSITTGHKPAQEPDLLILKCPVCSRTTFTSLQGLLNHARISHALEWGTHEECVRACAIADPDLNVQDGLEVGVGAGGMLPGLRTIFEMAVGPSYRESGVDDHTPSHDETTPDCPASTHLTKTLGLHEDSPALAAFLGKEPIRRGIKVYEQDESIDVYTLIQSSSKRTIRARERYSQRGEVRGIEENTEVTVETRELSLEAREKSCEDTRNPDSGSKPSAAMTRFHFTTRIVVTDRSLSIDSDKGIPFSHKWMLTVDAPSYAQNITTILRSMSVTPLSSVDVVRCSRPETNTPPFVIAGLASEPFLARIDLVFNGAETSNRSEGQPFSLEHWVDLDPLRCSTAVIGEEQICDVELDKRTVIGAPSAPSPINLKAFWKLAEDSLPAGNPTADWGGGTSRTLNILKDLLPRFPLTLQDVKRRRGMKPVPYRLVASESQLLNLVEGRRKAIEWGRARALRDVFNEVVKQDQAAKLSPLTAADVYSWMRDEGHLRPHTKVLATANLSAPNEIADGELGPRWCSLCGLERSLHSSILDKRIQDEGTLRQEEHTAIMDISCLIAAQHGGIVKLRPIDVKRAQPSSALASTQYSAGKLSTSLDPPLTQYVVRIADPHLALEVRRVIYPLRLPCFAIPSSRESEFPLDELGQTHAEVESTLAPYSFLALCLRPFIRNVVLSGLDVAKRQKGIAIAQAIPRKASKKELQDQISNISLLTPAHILTGIRKHSRSGDRTDEAVLLCLSSIGTTFEPRQKEGDNVPKKPVAVKMEQP